MNVQLVLTGVLSFFWGGFVTPVSIRLAHDYQIIDLPDHRKVHKRRTPRGAGLGLWGGYLLWALYFVPDFPELRYSAASATLVFFCGYMDDMKSLSPFVRLAVHVFASFVIVLPMPMPLLSKLECLVWIAGVTSAYNLIDGINGLCISVFISSALFLCLVGEAYFGVAGAAMALGVLCWNFPMAQTFLGDGGSTLLGFLFASHFVSAASPVLAKTQLHELTLLLLLWGGVPVFDTLVAFSRRILMGKSPFYPDKGHLHHHLMALTRSNFSAVTCLLAIHVLSLACAAAVYAKLRA
jgi:UDP-GlcNAc:undecaprenyl-phosphate GlcNAc-1-phosphate transferase